MESSSGVVAVYFGEPSEPYRPNVILPPNPYLGSKSNSIEEAQANIKKHYDAMAQFWTSQITPEQKEYCARLAVGDSGTVDLAQWLPPGYLEQQTEKATATTAYS